MIKKVLSIAIVTALSSTVFADDSEDLESLMSDLNSVSKGSIETNETNIDDLFNDLLEENNESKKNVNITDSSIDKDDSKTLEINDLMKKIRTEHKQIADYEMNKELDNLETFSQVSSSNEQFLKYIPVDTILKFNENILIPRKKEIFIYENGSPVLKVNNDNFSVCYLRFNSYEKPREILKDREFYIKYNSTKNGVLEDTNKNIFSTTFFLDNEHLNYIKCLSNKSDKPLTVSDFYNNFGSLITIELPEYEQI